MKKQKKLSVRMTIYCLIFVFLLSTLIGGIGFYTYQTKSVGHFEAYIEAVMSITADEVEPEALHNTLKTGEPGTHLELLQARLDSVKNNSGVEYIYIIARDDQGYYYVVCGYSRTEAEAGDERKQYGDRVTESDIALDMQQHFDAVMDGISEKEYVPNNSDLGYVLTGTVPIITHRGEIIAALGVDIPMEEIKEDLQNYVISVLISVCLAAAIFSVVFIIIIQKSIVSPILALGRHTDGFLKQTEGRPSDMKVEELQITTGDELEQLAGQMNKMMWDMVAYMGDLESVTAIQERINVQLNVASQIQQNMLPCVFPAFPERTEFDIYALMQPAGEVGGDFYDFFMTDGTHLGIVVADVSGDGIPAALFMMMTRTLIKNYACLGLEPARVLYEVNKELCQGNEAGMTVEAFVGLLDVYYGDFLYAVAGENTPLISRADGSFEQITTFPGFLMGMLEKIPFEQGRRKLETGNILVLHTAGIIDHEFALAKTLEDILTQDENSQAHSLQKLLHKTAVVAEDYMVSAGEKQDITLLAVEYRGKRS